MNDGLTPQHREIIRQTLAKVARVDRAVLFGSRATGTFGKASDIDLALEGQNLALSDLAFLRGEFAESSLPVEVDLIIRANIDNPELEERVAKEGTVFYEKEVTDHSIAIKRLAKGMQEIVFYQTVILKYVLALGALLFCFAAVFRWEAGASFGIFLIGCWAVLSVILAFLGCMRLLNAGIFLPLSMRHYVFGYILICSCSLPIMQIRIPFVVPSDIHIPIFVIVWLLYGLIPQYFIARWLAKEAEGGTMSVARIE
jgi:predicted nucleotidyltransferase